MFVAASEESGDNLLDGRGDAYCGMLNASYNLKLRNIRPIFRSIRLGRPRNGADMIHDFLPIARAVEGLNNLRSSASAQGR